MLVISFVCVYMFVGLHIFRSAYGGQKAESVLSYRMVLGYQTQAISLIAGASSQ